MNRLPLLALLLLALALRLGAGLLVDRQIAARGEAGLQFPDERDFLSFARHLAAEGEYRNDSGLRAWRTPLYSILLAAGIRAGGETRDLRLVNLAFGLLNVWLVYRIGALLFSRRTGVLAAAIAACDPYSVYFANLLLSETPACTAVLLLVLSGLRWSRRGRLRDAGGMGFAWAFAALVKPSLAALGPFALGFLLLRSVGAGGGRRALAAMGACLLAFCLGMAPWWARNAAVFGCFVPFSTMSGFTLHESFGPGADGGANHGKTPLPARAEAILAQLAHMPAASAAMLELELDATLRRAAFDSVGGMGRLLRLGAGKIARTWSPVPNWREAQAWPYRWASALFSLSLFLFVARACLVHRARWRDLGWLLVPAAFLFCLHAVFLGSVRYRLPACDCLAVLAAAGLLRSRATPRSMGAVECVR